MSLINCNYKCNCAIAAIIVGAIIGIVTAFLQITGVIVITPVALTVAFGIAVVYLGVLLIAGGQADRSGRCSCTCDTLNVLLAGILGTIALSVILLGFGIVATSVISAILVGLLLFFATLMLAGTACYVRNLADCGS